MEAGEAKQHAQPAAAGSVAASKVCSACYVPLASKLCCGKCKKRFYCSKPCQVADWKRGGHKIWCGRAGEAGFDFEIQATKDKGLGMFALRAFRVGDIILAEPPVLSLPQTKIYTLQHQEVLMQQLSGLSPGLIQAIDKLHPLEAPLVQKFGLNCLGAAGDVSRLFLNTSRINHACLPTCGHGYLTEHGVMLVNATRDIAVGQELSISYNHSSSTPLSNWNFECHCRACSDPVLGAKLVQARELDAQIIELGSNGKEIAAYARGKERVRLLQELGFGKDCLQRTYYDMFQMAVRRQETMDKAKWCIQRALESAILSEGENPDSDAVKRFRALARDPTKHPQYLALQESDVQMRKMGFNPMR